MDAEHDLGLTKAETVAFKKSHLETFIKFLLLGLAYWFLAVRGVVLAAVVGTMTL